MNVPINVSAMTKTERKALIKILQGNFTDRLIIQLGDTMVTGHGWEYAENPSWYTLYYKDKMVHQDATLDELFDTDNYITAVDDDELDAIRNWFDTFQPEW